MKKILFLLGFSLIASLGFAQDDYIITVKGDTIMGKVKSTAFTDEAYAITFIDNRKKRKRDYRINRLLGYSVKKRKGYQHFERKIIKRKKVFMQRLKGGKHKVFLYLESMAMGKERVVYYIEKDDTSFRLIDDNYKDVFEKHFSDCQKMISKLGKKGHRFKNILDIVEEYENCWKSEEDEEEEDEYRDDED